MAFRVDSTRLAAVVDEPSFGVRFRPPSGWEPLTAEDLARVEAATRGNAEAYEVDVAHVFVDPVHGSLLSVSSLDLGSDGALRSRIERYETLLQEQFAGTELKRAAFRKDGLEMTQFLLQPNGMVNFKLVFESPERRLLQFDYVVTQTRYPEEMTAIESSIGSIQSITPP